MKNYDATNKRLTLHLGTRVVVMLPFPSEHPTSLVEHPCLGIQYLLLVIIHVSVDNVVWPDLSVNDGYPNVVNHYLWISSVFFHQFSFSNKLFGGIANYHQRHVDILLVLPMTYFSWPGCVAIRMIPNLLICSLTWCSINMWWNSPSILVCTHHLHTYQITLVSSRVPSIIVV